MSAVNDLHSEAMDLAEFGLLERLRGNTEEAHGLFEQALERELAAIDALDEPIEPTYSVLHRSAATLAIDCSRLRQAEQIAARALAQSPHPEIAEELRDLLEQVNFLRHLEVRGVALAENELQMSLTGDAVGYGFVHSNEMLSRLNNAGVLMHRVAEWLSRKPYRKKGRPKKNLAENYQIYMSVPRAASYAVTLRFGYLVEQLPIAGMPDSGMPETHKVINEFMNIVDLVNGSEISEIEKHISDPEYLWNFLSLVRNIAPDGERVRQVGFTAVRGNEEQKVAIARPRSKFPTTHAESGVTESVEVRGWLRRADAFSEESNKIGIRDESGTSRVVIVPTNQMDDIVRPLWGKKVVVTGTRRLNEPSGPIKLQTILPLEEDQLGENSYGVLGSHPWSHSKNLPLRALG